MATTSRVSSRRIVGGNAGRTVSGSTSLVSQTSAYRRTHIAPGMVEKPIELARLLNAMQDATEEATLAARSNPEAGAIILGPYVATGQLLDINHLLNRAPVSVTCVRAIGAAWTGYEVSLAAAATAGLDARKTIRLQMPATGTFYFRFA